MRPNQEQTTMAKRPLPYPDLILYNGKIRTLASDTDTCEALACVG